MNSDERRFQSLSHRLVFIFQLSFYLIFFLSPLLQHNLEALNLVTPPRTQISLARFSVIRVFQLFRISLASSATWVFAKGSVWGRKSWEKERKVGDKVIWRQCVPIAHSFLPCLKVSHRPAKVGVGRRIYTGRCVPSTLLPHPWNQSKGNMAKKGEKAWAKGRVWKWL